MTCREVRLCSVYYVPGSGMKIANSEIQLTSLLDFSHYMFLTLFSSVYLFGLLSNAAAFFL